MIGRDSPFDKVQLAEAAPTWHLVRGWRLAWVLGDVRLLLTAQALAEVPSHLSETAASSDGYPKHAWRIEVETRLGGVPLYRGRFPIRVLPA